MILDQRSDIEQFFLEALEQVKEERRRKAATMAAQQQSMQPQNQQFLPLIDPKSKFSKSNFEKQQNSYMAEAQKQSQPQPVELAELDWEDRERVLRLMFSKMNSGQAPSNWRQFEAGPTSGNRTTTGGVTSNAGRGELNQSFREGDNEGDEEEEDDGYDQEIDEDNEGEEEDDDDDRQ